MSHLHLVEKPRPTPLRVIKTTLRARIPCDHGHKWLAVYEEEELTPPPSTRPPEPAITTTGELVAEVILNPHFPLRSLRRVA